MKLLIISGLSGSGKSIVLHALEDMGYYCIDNLPLSLIPEYMALLKQDEQKTREITRSAIGIDSRNLADLHRFPDIRKTLEIQGIDIQTVFLYTNNAVLLNRFSETRRRHPLSGDNVVLAEAIQNENALLEPLHLNADAIIDTTHTTVHQLRRIVTDRFGDHKTHDIALLFESFGYKKGIPGDADFVFDVRCLPNPHWETKLRPHTGLHEDVAAFLKSQAEVMEMQQSLIDFLDKWLPKFRAENRSYLNIAIGCTGGQHRSVFLVRQLVNYYKNAGFANINERHRELA